MFTISAESMLQSLAYCNYFAPSVQKYGNASDIPDKSCYDSAIFCPLYLILKYRETIFTLCFYLLATSGLSYSIQLYSWWGYGGLCSCLRKQDSLLHVWYPSYQDMHEPLPFLPLLKLRKKKWWDRWMQYQCSKGHEIKCCGTFAKSD